MISVRGLRKHYKVHKRPPGLKAAFRSLIHRNYTTVKAVDGISFEIRPGERVGFLGPNGAGKTTTLKMLSGLLAPTGGLATVGGHRPFERSSAFLRSIMLVTGQKQQLIWDLPPSETFELNRAIYDLPRAEYRRTLDELVALLRLEPLIGKPTRQLYLGERMKCELAAALLHRPRVLFLDEPTIGLDVTMQAAVRRFIQAYNEQHGATVILTSHYMDDVAALCPRVIVIDQGQLTYDGSLAELARKLRPEKRITLRLEHPVERSALEVGGARIVSIEPDRVVLGVEAGRLREQVAAALAQLPIADLTVEDAPLEEVLSELFARGHEP
jgi:ABC-2 type transport system ATP-binding protein